MTGLNNKTVLVVIADDLTGAMDTGIKFQAIGIDTKVILEKNLLNTPMTSQVIVVDTETRHTSSREAYKTVQQVVMVCQHRGIRYFYKKTDSAMRGHIGSELTALANVLNKEVAFVPALPEENRVTHHGIQYIDGIPVGESIFSKDPFNPVTDSEIWRIIGQESDIQVIMKDKKSLSLYEQEDKKSPKIIVYDAENSEVMQKIAASLKQSNRVSAVAGCSGFAGYYSEMLPLKKSESLQPSKTKRLFVISGSLNTVTQKQIMLAEKKGAYRICLNDDQKFKKDYLQEYVGKKWLVNIKETAEKHRITILDVCLSEDKKQKVSGDLSASKKLVRRLSDIAQIFMSQMKDTTFMIIGGDTLFALVDSLNVSQIIPVCEVVQGVPLFKINAKVKRKKTTVEKIFQIISKSGGFGTENLIDNVAKIILRS